MGDSHILITAPHSADPTKDAFKERYDLRRGASLSSVTHAVVFKHGSQKENFSDAVLKHYTSRATKAPQQPGMAMAQPMGMQPQPGMAMAQPMG